MRQPIKYLLAAMLMALPLARPAHTEGFSASVDRATDALKSDDYVTAFVQLVPAAEAGLARAQFLLGTMYQDGLGLPKSVQTAIDWYRKAGAQDSVNAQLRLAELFLDGDDVFRNREKGLAWLRSAANLGHPDAALRLARFHLEDEEGDRQSGVNWLQKAAEFGQPDAQYRLASAYVQGKIIPRDVMKAVKWFKQAAKQNHVEAKTALGYVYGEGYGVEPDAKSAIQYYMEAAEQGDPQAQHNLGLMLAEDRAGHKADHAKAYYWLSIAAYHGIEDASKGIQLVVKKLSEDQVRAINKTLQDYFAARNAEKVRQLIARGKTE